jgi:hypothetical protein
LSLAVVKPVWSLDNPPIVDIFGDIARHLLLMRRSAFVCVFDRIVGCMAVQPARRAVGVSQSHLGTMNDFQGLATDDGTQSTLYTTKVKIRNKPNF